MSVYSTSPSVCVSFLSTSHSSLERAGYTGSVAVFPNMQFLDHSIDTSLPVQDLTSFNLQGSQMSLTCAYVRHQSDAFYLRLTLPQQSVVTLPP